MFATEFSNQRIYQRRVCSTMSIIIEKANWNSDEIFNKFPHVKGREGYRFTL